MGLVQKSFSDIITFSRSSNATRVGPTGLVQYAPHNLLLQSETFGTTWTTGNASVTSNAIAAPNGTVTADKLVENTANASHQIVQAVNVTVGVTYTLSMYVKAGERTKFRISPNLQSAGFGYANNDFDLSTGTVISTAANYTSTIQSVGNGWYRCTVTAVAGATAGKDFLCKLLDASGSDSYTGDGTSGCFLWGAQWTVGPYALDYTPTTSAAVYGPRFDYDPVTLAARGLLVEESRTNLLTYSEQFDNAAWTVDNITKTANTTAAPDGTVNADSIIETVASGNHRTNQSISKAASAITYTVSVYAKTNGRNIRVSFDSGSAANAVEAGFNLTSGTISVAASAAGTFSGASATITSVGNGWYRCTITGTTGTELTVRPNIWLLNGTTQNYTGDGISGIFIWGAQLEAGAFATSYIPTLASTVTRSADVASVNTLSPFYNATEGTVYAEVDTDAFATSANDRAAFEFNDTTVNNFFRLQRKASTQAASALGISGGSLLLDTTNFASWTTGNVFKLAIGVKANDVGMVANGGSVSTDTSYTMPTVTRLELGSGRSGDYLCGHLRRLAYYPRRLTNAELQALTA